MLQPPGPVPRPPAVTLVDPPLGSSSSMALDAQLGPLPTVDEFVSQNCLESWVAEALHMLGEEQRAHVMRTPLNPENTTNLNGVITSRIKEVAAVDQRLQMFIQLNGLAEGVVDRLGTLSQ